MAVAMGCDSLAPITSLCHGHGTCTHGATPMCICDAGYVTVSHYISAHGAASRCLIRKDIVDALWTTFLAGIIFDMIITLRHIFLTIHAQLILVRTSTGTTAVGRRSFSSSSSSILAQLLIRLWSLPRIRFMLFALIFWLIFHSAFIILYLIHGKDALVGTSVTSTFLYIIAAGTACAAHMYASSLVLQSLLHQGQSARQSANSASAAAAVAARSSPSSTAPTPALTANSSPSSNVFLHWLPLVCMPLPYLGFGCMLIPAFSDQHMPAAATVHWITMSMSVMIPAVCFAIGGRRLSQQLDETIAATVHLLAPQRPSQQQQPAPSTNTNNVSQDTHKVHPTSTTIPAASSSPSPSPVDSLRALSKKARLVSLVGVVIGSASVTSLFIVGVWPLLRGAGAYAGACMGINATIAYAVIIFLFEVALKGDRKRAQQARDAAKDMDVDANTTHQFHSIKSETIPDQDQRRDSLHPTSDRRGTTVQTPLPPSPALAPASPQVAWQVKNDAAQSTANFTDLASPCHHATSAPAADDSPSESPNWTHDRAHHHAHTVSDQPSGSGASITTNTNGPTVESDAAVAPPGSVNCHTSTSSPTPAS